jgi:hypothetical protein
VLLIAIGVYFLLENLGLVSGLNWLAALQLWPLLLVFLGLNIIVRQAPGAAGGVLSFLLAVVAVGIFGFVLLAEDSAFLNRLGLNQGSNVQVENIAYETEADSAEVVLDFGSPGARVYALTDSTNLIEGEVSYTGRLIFDADTTGDMASVRLDTEGVSGVVFVPNILNWGERDEWRIGLNPNVALQLDLDVGSGATDLDLGELTLTDLVVDGGSGRTDLRLPPGGYDANLDVGTGSWEVTLPNAGNLRISVDGGPGNLTLILPADMAARVELDGGPGSFEIDDRFTRLEEDDEQEVWETEGYESAADRIELIVDQSAGFVRIVEP